MESPLLSIIVPVYRVENTLEQCAQSILAQDYPEMEVILVDDGSPDRCPALCDEWVRRDARIRVLHKKNGGLSDARNAGIEVARGEFLTFVDSDDYLEAGTYGALMEILNDEGETDILEYPVNIHEGSPREHRLSLPEATYTDAATYWRETEAWHHTYAWNKIYRRSLFRDVRFPVGKVFEDIHTLPLLLERARAIRTTARGLYHYRHNPSGITALAHADAYRSLLEAHLKLQEKPVFALLANERYRLELLHIQIYAHELSCDRPRMPYRPFCRILTPKTFLYNLLGPRLLCALNRIMRKVVKR